MKKLMFALLLLAGACAPELDKNEIWELAQQQRIDDRRAAQLSDLIEEGTDPGTLRAALWAISRRPKDAPIERVTVLAKTHEDARVRRQAARLLWTARADDALRALLDTETDPTNRRELTALLELRSTR